MTSPWRSVSWERLLVSGILGSLSVGEGGVPRGIPTDYSSPEQFAQFRADLMGRSKGWVNREAVKELKRRHLEEFQQIKAFLQAEALESTGSGTLEGEELIGTGYIYLLVGEGGLVKVGFTKRLKERLGSYNRAATKCKFLGAIGGGRELERAFHWSLREFRVPGKKEWFILSVGGTIYKRLLDTFSSGLVEESLFTDLRGRSRTRENTRPKRKPSREPKLEKRLSRSAKSWKGALEYGIVKLRNSAYKGTGSISHRVDLGFDYWDSVQVFLSRGHSELGLVLSVPDPSLPLGRPDTIVVKTDSGLYEVPYSKVSLVKG